jgi:hypothetical protein
MVLVLKKLTRGNDMFMQYCKKQLPSKHKKSTIATTLTIAGIFAILMSLSILFQIGSLSSAHALSHYFNCIIRGANKSGAVTLTNVETCYDKVFKGANTNQALDNNNNNAK